MPGETIVSGKNSDQTDRLHSTYHDTGPLLPQTGPLDVSALESLCLHPETSLSNGHDISLRRNRVFHFNRSWFNQAVDTLKKFLEQDKHVDLKTVSSTTSSTTERPGYDVAAFPHSAELDIIAGYGVHDDVLYRRMTNTGEVKVTLAQEKLPSHEAVAKLCKDRGVTAILPSHREQGTVGRNVAEAITWLGQTNVFSMDTEDGVSLRESRQFGAYAYEQEKVFNLVNFDWQRLREIAHIDIENIHSNEPLPGSKGKTLLAGTILATVIAEAEGEHPDRIVVLHDTDITNPGEYMAIPLLLVPFIKEQETPQAKRVSMVEIGKNGIGRNNEAISAVPGEWINERDEDLRHNLLVRLGYELGPSMWPLTGERAIPLSQLRKILFATGIGAEVTFNSCIGGMSITDQKGSIEHVPNPNPKNENRESPAEREFGDIILQCQRMLQDIGKHIRRTDKLPNKWDLPEIQAYNEMFGGKLVIDFVHPNDLGPQKPVIHQTNYIIPPIDILIRERVITLPK